MEWLQVQLWTHVFYAKWDNNNEQPQKKNMNGIMSN